MYKTKSGKDIDYSNIKKKTVFKSTLENGELYTRISAQTHNQQLYIRNRLQRIE